MGRRPKDEPPTRAAIHDVVPSALELDSQRTRHGRTTYGSVRPEPYSRSQDLTSLYTNDARPSCSPGEQWSRNGNPMSHVKT